jgi:ketosteroid isomerase-like protein
VKANEETERQVSAAVDSLLNHFAAGDVEGAMDCFAEDADIALYGSEVSEVVIGPVAMRAFFQRVLGGISKPRFTLSNRRVSAGSDVSWFTADAEVDIGGVRASPYRLVAVLEKRHGRWLWTLFSGSEPLPDRC